MSTATNRFSTKDQLINLYGISYEEGTVYHTDKFGHKHKLVSTNIVCKHKFCPNVIYKGYGFSFHGKSYILLEHRLNYIWFKGDIPEGLEVDHIDGNPLNNDPSNLRLLTHKQNLEHHVNQRARNQWGIWNEQIALAQKAIDKANTMPIDDPIKVMVNVDKYVLPLVRMSYRVCHTKYAHKTEQYAKIVYQYDKLCSKLMTLYKESHPTSESEFFYPSSMIDTDALEGTADI